MKQEYEIQINYEWQNQDAGFVRDSLISFNLLKCPTAQHPPSHTINLIIKGEDGKVIGGLLGGMYRFAYYPDILWVDDEHRHQGYGARLLSEIEGILREKGCRFIHLDTFSFQAPEFYIKNGFKVFGILDDYPEGIVRYSFKKVL